MVAWTRVLFGRISDISNKVQIRMVRLLNPIAASLLWLVLMIPAVVIYLRQYKCELCETYTCPHCLELIGYSKTDPHTCNPDNVASAELIKKDTKPCPQCGVRIHKISGCDQMWCTECRVAFSYKTLKIDSGAAVHNPHYYQYMQRQNHGVAPRNPQDVVCGGANSPQSSEYYDSTTT